MTSAQLALVFNFEVALHPEDEEWELHANN